MSFHDKKFNALSNDSQRMLELLDHSRNLGNQVGMSNSKQQIKKNSKSPYHDIERALFLWYDNQIKNNFKVTTFEIRKESLRIAKSLGRNDFGASNGWIYNWRQKYFRPEKLPEPPKEDPARLPVPKAVPKSSEKKNELVDIFKNYTCENLFVADECFIYYKRLPKSGFKDFSGRVDLGHSSNEKILILLCCNLQGDEKLKPFIIGPNIDYRVFKKKEGSPCRFVKRDNVNINLTLFYDWLTEFNNYCKAKERKVVIFVKPTEEHFTSYTFTNIKVVFYPCDGVEGIHPMDSGIALNFKCYLRKMLCEKYKMFYSFGNSDIVAEFTEPFNVIDVIFSVKIAWERVDKDVIFDAYKTLFQLHDQGISFGKFDLDFITEIKELDFENKESVGQVWPIKAHLELTKQDAFWGLILLKNAVIQLGLPIYKEYLALENNILGKELKPTKTNKLTEYWYLSYPL